MNTSEKPTTASKKGASSMTPDASRGGGDSDNFHQLRQQVIDLNEDVLLFLVDKKGAEVNQQILKASFILCELEDTLFCGILNKDLLKALLHDMSLFIKLNDQLQATPLGAISYHLECQLTVCISRYLKLMGVLIARDPTERQDIKEQFTAITDEQVLPFEKKGSADPDPSDDDRNYTSFAGGGGGAGGGSERVFSDNGLFSGFRDKGSARKVDPGTFRELSDSDDSDDSFVGNRLSSPPSRNCQNLLKKVMSENERLIEEVMSIDHSLSDDKVDSDNSDQRSVVVLLFDMHTALTQLDQEGNEKILLKKHYLVSLSQSLQSIKLNLKSIKFVVTAIYPLLVVIFNTDKKISQDTVQALHTKIAEICPVASEGGGARRDAGGGVLSSGPRGRSRVKQELKPLAPSSPDSDGSGNVTQAPGLG